MSVLACARENCRNIMCNRWSHEFGHICEDCFQELVDLGPSTNIHEFMDCDVPRNNPREASEAYFNKIFLNNVVEDY